MKTLTIDEILKIIPHRYPFILVDRVDFLEPGIRGTGVKCVTSNEIYFQGHFPQEKVMPGVLIIEALAQVGAVVLLSKEGYQGKIAYFAGIKNAKFRKKVIPGDTMYLEMELVKSKGTIGIGRGFAKVGEDIVCEAELLFAVGN